MPREASGGNLRTLADGTRATVVRIGANDKRKLFALPTCKTEPAARERASIMSDVASRLRRAGRPPGIVEDWIGELARAPHDRAVKAVLGAVEPVIAGTVERLTDVPTFEEFATMWTDGRLHKRWPDHVKRKKTADDDAQRLAKHVFPYVVGVHLDEFKIDHAELVMANLDANLAAGTRRQVAQTIHRILGFAVYPGRYISANPLPRGFMPKVGPRKAKGMIYPEEESSLLACRKVPLKRRMIYGFTAREGPRYSEAIALTWADVDLRHGLVKLDENKTDDPRSWSLAPEVVRALTAWKALTKGKPNGTVFGIRKTKSERQAATFRADLIRAGITRPELHNSTKSRLAVRFHDLRGVFVTMSLANGRSETWVADRTGHKSSVMINTYRRTARSWSEANIGTLADMALAIPELANDRQTGGSKGGGTGRTGKRTPEKTAKSLKRKGCVSVSKSAVRTGVRVRIPPSAPRGFEGDPVQQRLTTDSGPRDFGDSLGDGVRPSRGIATSRSHTELRRAQRTRTLVSPTMARTRSKP
jgi:integrase